MIKISEDLLKLFDIQLEKNAIEIQFCHMSKYAKYQKQNFESIIYQINSK